MAATAIGNPWAIEAGRPERGEVFSIMCMKDTWKAAGTINRELYILFRMSSVVSEAQAGDRSVVIRVLAEVGWTLDCVASTG